MFAAVRDTSADATWVRGHISAEEQLVDPAAEPEISMTAAHAPVTTTTPRRHQATDEGPAAPRRVSVLSGPRPHPTGDLLNIAKHSSPGPTRSNLTRLLLMQPSRGGGSCPSDRPYQGSYSPVQCSNFSI